MEVDRLIDYSAAIRPTRHRLAVAMGISACCVAVLLGPLGSLVNLAASVSKGSTTHGDRLTVFIREGEGEPNSELLSDNQADSSLSQEVIVSAEYVGRRQEVVTVYSPEPAADSPQATDWRALAKEAARASVDEYFRNEESRASMWRQSRSIMFQPTSDFVVKEEDPVIADFRFKPQVHVAGLGITIGSCFIGVPLVGVPVEQRTVAIRLFVCAKDSG